MRSVFLSSAVALVLSGCASVVPMTLARLNLLDPFTADPAGFAVALETDDGIEIERGTAVLTFEAVHSPSGEMFREDLRLIEDRSEDGRVIYSIAPDGVDALRSMQTELLPWKDTSDGNSTLTLSVTASGCLIDATVVPDDPRGSVYLQLATEAPLRPLVRDAPLSALFDVDELAELPQCGA